MARIYVAGKYEEAERCREIMWILREAGHTITYDWTLNDQDTEEQAWNDLLGVEDAQALVLVLEKDLKYQGAWVEMGVALARRIPVYIIGSYGVSNIFTRLSSLVTRGFGHLLDEPSPR